MALGTQETRNGKPTLAGVYSFGGDSRPLRGAEGRAGEEGVDRRTAQQPPRTETALTVPEK